jgi:hypothetical protein
VEANEDTDAEAVTDLDAGGVMKSRRRTRSTVGKKSASAVPAAIFAVKAAEKKKRKRNRKAASPPAVVTPSIPMPRLREVESEGRVAEDRPARRSDSLAAKRQQEPVQKTSKDALRRGLEAQRTAAAAQARMPVMIKHRVFWPKTRLPAVTR